MLVALCRQFGKDARPERNLLIYSYENKHSEKAVENSDIEVVFVNVDDKSSK
jgi:hypothetical protein